MILEEIKGGSLLAPVPDDHGGASDNLPLVTLGVQLIGQRTCRVACCLAQSRGEFEDSLNFVKKFVKSQEEVNHD